MILKQDSEIQRYAVHHIHLLQRSFKSRQSQVNLDWLITKIRSTGLRIWLQRDPDHDYLWMVAQSYLGWLNHAKPLEIMGCLNHRFQLVQDFATIHRMLWLEELSGLGRVLNKHLDHSCLGMSSSHAARQATSEFAVPYLFIDCPGQAASSAQAEHARSVLESADFMWFFQVFFILEIQLREFAV